MIDQPDLTRRQFVERFHFTDGSGGDGGFCGLEWQPLPDGRLLVIAYEHPDNPTQSVTNAAEFIYKQFAEQAGIDPRRIVWVENYPPDDMDETPKFDRCLFTKQPDGTLKPDWTRMRAEHWHELGIAQPPIPTFTRIELHPEAARDESPVPDNIGDYYPPPRQAGPRGEVAYEGRRVIDEDSISARVEVTISDAHGTRPLHPRLDLRRHSASGLEWGYEGSGPAQLALALLADLTDDVTAERHYQDFKFSVIARLPYDGWEMTATEMREMLARLRLKQPPPAPGVP